MLYRWRQLTWLVHALLQRHSLTPLHISEAFEICVPNTCQCSEHEYVDREKILYRSPVMSVGMLYRWCQLTWLVHALLQRHSLTPLHISEAFEICVPNTIQCSEHEYVDREKILYRSPVMSVGMLYRWCQLTWLLHALLQRHSLTPLHISKALETCVSNTIQCSEYEYVL